MNLNDKVQAALDELKDILRERVELIANNGCEFSMEGFNKRAEHLQKKEQSDFEFEEKVQNLVNALDDSSIPEKADCGIVEDTKEEMPVKDLPEVVSQKSFLYKDKNGLIRRFYIRLRAVKS